MPGFKTHITASSLLGAGYAGSAFVVYHAPLPTCLLAGGLCGVAGMLPDLDSGPGVPLRESVAFAAAVIPMMLVHHFQALGLSHESIILAGAGVYLLIRFGVTELLKRFTVHRGMFHSLPAAAMAGELGFLLSAGEDVRLRFFLGSAVVLGYMSHLVLDEVWSLEWKHGRIGFKKSFGTALKLFGHGWWPNISAFAKLAILTFLVLREPNWMQRYYQQQPTGVSAQQTTGVSAQQTTGVSAQQTTRSADGIRR